MTHTKLIIRIYQIGIEKKVFTLIKSFPGCYNKHKTPGTYLCVVCRQELFSSDNKFDSGCGWPAFNDVLEKGKVTLHHDTSLGKNHKFYINIVFKCIYLI